MSRILATGGAGYIGSHVAVALAAAGHEVVILDNFENSTPQTVGRIESITGTRIPVIEADVRHRGAVEWTLRHHRIDAVIHLAGKKAVGESVADPLMYFDENLNGAIALLGAMARTGVTRLVFSSSATVYGTPQTLPIHEAFPTSVLSPYGRTKLMIEEMIDDVTRANPALTAISLRYFNPVGAHSSGLIGEDPRDIPNNLFPFVAQAAAGLRDAVNVFGGDYPTPDGTGLRDYIHVSDLARGHVCAIDHALSQDVTGTARPAGGHLRVNLGAGRGYTVLEVIAAFARACGHPVPHRIVSRRAGDIAASVADPALAERLFGWTAQQDLDRMCADHWHFQCAALARAGGTDTGAAAARPMPPAAQAALAPVRHDAA